MIFASVHIDPASASGHEPTFYLAAARVFFATSAEQQARVAERVCEHLGKPAYY